MPRRYLIATILVGAIVPGVLRAADPTLPTADDIHKSFQAGNYQETLRDIARVISIHGEIAKQYDRYDLLIMKAESLLRVKSSSGASQAFAEAAKLAPDRNAAAIAEATDLLIRKSSGLVYHPHPEAKGGKKPLVAKDPDSVEGIDVVDPAKRKEALSAFYDDEASAFAPKLKAAMEGKSLAPILIVVKGAHEVHVLELAAKGIDETTKDLVSKLAEHSRELMREALRTEDDRVDTIKKQAEEVVPYKVPVPDPGGKGKFHMEDHTRRRGLDGKQTKELNGYLADCEKIPRAAKDLLDALGTDANYFEDVVKKAAALHGKTDEVLKADYTLNYYGNR